ncbi:MAG TPA: rhodanese-like domain-containing protein [Thermomicrobiaceae bacterium]|nr:rhodanese-like domain-containing protein [Thermomicrobiaceae bacterium]
MIQAQGERPEVPEISVQEAEQRARSGQAVIVDVREPEELEEASVPGALHIPLGQLAQRAGELPQDRELLLFCRSGNRSSFATAYLRQAGRNDAVNVAGGIIAWAEAGLPLRLGS